ncbi:TatD family hydrolase [Bradyrhizobium sp. 183]|uniref:Qat anti-phage system TatD family nuclease QatD n=1 Tax=unclassified Bradyrhizobium TaxID=2631580 RepID=UPI001FFF1B90|nr:MULTISPECIES: Qat anti-phage system TatD family nuclease QatD [unclassified Bradyrhizobium]UPJ81116.1 TatD family hydrolase [Bradyrhizobium sp. 184]UPJ88910.1 TatD family hydrolase [Bradyrhizobium sp. 183]
MIDLHAHIDLYPDPVATTKECVDRNLFVLSVTTTPSAWSGTAALAKDAARIRTALGLHPQIAQERQSELALFEELLSSTRYVGEIGLDGGPELKGTWDIQRRVFDEILRMCSAAGGRIMTIHSRRAATQVLDSLAARSEAGAAILHWFSGTRRELQRAVDQGCWFSVGPAMLAGEKGRTMTAVMPPDRILTESDGPFAQINGRPLFPWDVETAEKALAKIWRVSDEEARHRLMENLRRLANHVAPEKSDVFLHDPKS